MDSFWAVIVLLVGFFLLIFYFKKSLEGVGRRLIAYYFDRRNKLMERFESDEKRGGK